ncbi:E3 ubiquitin-protein ligase synoviolin B-like [Acanthaster planci]|uniref:RING-type E3 ubiquitin transferase n=1 Tax=Acanthaster planci TaxID=133434 RepID=A0A8B7YUI3_ACAPL|nr:E3 ubiquitin-protein ligase synoviolin B-like [Acanthaster planci]
MRGFLLTVASFGLTASVVGHAFFQKKQFYPSVVYLTKSNPSMAVIYMQAFVLVVLMGKLFKKVFFGQLRAAEMEHLIERSWYAVTETCLAFTVFRDDFSPKFVAMFTFLLFLKCFHWLAEDRVDYMERSPVISWLFHIRVLGLLAVLGTLDMMFMNYAYYSTLTKGASVQLVFGFEYAILFTIIINISFKYVLHTIDLQSENPWESKAVYMLYTDLIMSFVKVMLYTVFLAIMIKVHTFPLFAIRPMYLAMRSFKKAVNDVIMSRRAIRNMNTLYPDATAEDLASADNVCIICREEMVTGCKKLPCGHIFHTACLRSWFQRQQTCPTCRMDVLRAPAATVRVQVNQQQPQQQQQQPQMPGMMPPFPGYPFWMPQFHPGAQLPNQQLQQQQQAAGAPAASQQPAQAQGGTVPATPPAASQQTGDSSASTTQPAAGSTDGAAASATSSSDPSSLVPPFPFMMPPPPFFMMPPFATPPPMPPPDFAGLTEEELRAMEGTERQHLEARIECLRGIHTLLDAAMVQIQQYMSVVGELGIPPPPPSTSLYGYTSPATSTTPMTSAASAPDSTTTTDSADSGATPKVSAGTVPTLKKDKDSSADLTSLDGASGFTPPTEGELIPEYEEGGSEELDHGEIRRRRLQRLQSRGSDN